MAAAAAIGNIGRMAGQVFKGLANPNVALPLAAVGVPMAIGGSRYGRTITNFAYAWV